MKLQNILVAAIGTVGIGMSRAISTGANEPIASNALGLATKDCALQFCAIKDAMALWLTLVPSCYVPNRGLQTLDPAARRDARMCAQFLCPRRIDDATMYLQSGCFGNFS